MLFMKYDQQWRMIRKMCHSLLNVQAARTYVPYQVLENKQMLNDLLDTPDDFVNHMRRCEILSEYAEIKIFEQFDGLAGIRSACTFQRRP